MTISPAVMMFIIIHTISTGAGGLPLEPTPEGVFNYSISSPSSNATTAAAATTSAAAATSSSSSSSSKFPFLPSPDYLIRLRRNNRTSVFYAYFHSFEEKGEGAILNLNPLPLRREPSVGTSLPNHEYDDKGAMYFAIVIVLLYGISIALLIASTVRSSRTDDELKTFMRSFAGVNRAKRREDKQKVHRLLQLHEPQGPLTVLPEAQIASSSSLLLPCHSSKLNDLGLDDETDRRRSDENPSVTVSRCISAQPSCETVSLYDSVPFIDE